ncbi:hypothetical protein ONZ51_g10781 [Trametes cubensis]|uniref:DUF6533 domain-containing protein n=1 Tax=Trametes cubensis TaxID=1111947 RepID=A0AAD7X6Y6_9APHY|nr:hypothetical protein ONZ51_g10781 [Trametes cubensis]
MDPAQISETVAVYQSVQVVFFCDAAVTALVVYNWLINLGDEVDLFWSAPTKGASLLYFAIRYLAFVEPIIAMCTFYPMADKVGSDHDPRCVAVYWITVLVGPFVYIAPAIFSANRAYALSEKTRLVYCAVLMLALGPFFADLIDNVVWTRPVNLPPPALCSEQDNTPPSANLLPLTQTPSRSRYDSVLLFSRLSATTADLIVVVVTWRATHKVLRETRGLLKVSITQVLLFNDDLLLHTSVLLLMNIGHIIMTELSVTDFTEATSYLSLFMDPFMSILATDFLLNLQKATAASSRIPSNSGQDQPGTLGEVPSLNFAVITQSGHTESTTADASSDADHDDDLSVAEV